MITIQHQERQIEIHASFLTRWLDQLGRAINRILDFSTVRKITRQKENMLRELGADQMIMI